jgi:hypothetical protein
VKKIIVLRNTGADLPRFSEGQVVDVQDKVAELLCGLKLAEVLQAVPPETLHAVPDISTVLTAEDVAEPPQPKRPSKTKPESKE